MARPKRAIGASTKAPTTKQLATDVKKLDKKIKRLGKPEVDYFDIPVTSTATIAYNLDVTNYPLVEPPIGLNDQERKGDEITMKSIQVRAVVRAGASSTVPQSIRMMVIQSKQRFSPALNAATGSDNSVLAYGGTQDAVWSPVDWNNKHHYRVLKDMTFYVQNGTDKEIKNIKWTTGFKTKATLKFEEGTTIVAEQNQVYLLFFSDILNTNTPPTLEFTSRTHYTDA